MRQYIITLAAAVLIICSCDRQLDIVPKGQVTLGKLSELELLLEQEFIMNESPCNNIGIICGEDLGMFDQVSTILSQTNTCTYAFLTGDESVNRATLTTNDYVYNNIYKYIASMNVILEKADEAEGLESSKPAIKAEAQVLRAWFHFLAAAIYARQYDASTAASDGGIAISTSSSVVEVKEKLSLAKAYEHILSDLDDSILADLPDDHGRIVGRGDKAWGYAAKAMVLFQMKNYTEALKYAQKALDARSEIFDRSEIAASAKWEQSYDSANNYLYIEGCVRISPTMVLLTPETVSKFEADDFVIKYEGENGWSKTNGESMSGLSGVYSYAGWNTFCNVYGITTEQMHYVAAECLIRSGKIDEGLALVDKVRKCRVENASASSASTEAEAMAILQKAKWVECINTPYNFLDCKRWNSESEYRRDIVHDLGEYGKYTIKPDSKLWVMAFPSNAVRYNSTLTQNF